MNNQYLNYMLAHNFSFPFSLNFYSFRIRTWFARVPGLKRQSSESKNNFVLYGTQPRGTNAVMLIKDTVVYNNNNGVRKMAVVVYYSGTLVIKIC